MNEVATHSNGALAPMGGDPYAAYGAKVGVSGVFLSFKAGEYLYGQDDKELPNGTRLAANMAGLRIGWRRWFASTVTDDLTELLADCPHIAQRNTLGDDDPAKWETDTKGEPRDPWQLTNVLELIDGEGQQYIFSTASKGGIGAIGRLCKQYGKEYRQRPGMVPIVELGKDFYIHKEHGKTYFPMLTIVDWTDENALTIEEAAEEERVAPPSKAPEPAPTPAPAAASAKKTTRF
jgi:hypothetical protein